MPIYDCRFQPNVGDGGEQLAENVVASLSQVGCPPVDLLFIEPQPTAVFDLSGTKSVRIGMSPAPAVQMGAFCAYEDPDFGLCLGVSTNEILNSVSKPVVCNNGSSATDRMEAVRHIFLVEAKLSWSGVNHLHVDPTICRVSVIRYGTVFIYPGRSFWSNYYNPPQVIGTTFGGAVRMLYRNRSGDLGLTFLPYFDGLFWRIKQGGVGATLERIYPLGVGANVSRVEDSGGLYLMKPSGSPEVYLVDFAAGTTHKYGIGVPSFSINTATIAVPQNLPNQPFGFSRLSSGNTAGFSFIARNPDNTIEIMNLASSLCLVAVPTNFIFRSPDGIWIGAIIEFNNRKRLALAFYQMLNGIYCLIYLVFVDIYYPSSVIFRDATNFFGAVIVDESSECISFGIIPYNANPTVNSIVHLNLRKLRYAVPHVKPDPTQITASTDITWDVFQITGTPSEVKINILSTCIPLDAVSSRVASPTGAAQPTITFVPPDNSLCQDFQSEYGSSCDVMLPPIPATRPTFGVVL